VYVPIMDAATVVLMAQAGVMTPPAVDSARNIWSRRHHTADVCDAIRDAGSEVAAAVRTCALALGALFLLGLGLLMVTFNRPALA
jgi:hypothetical protein